MENRKFGFYFLLFIIVLLAIKFYTIIYVFFPSIATGFVLAYIFQTLYCLLIKIIRSRTIAGLSIILFIFILFLIPLTIIIFGVEEQVASLFTDETIDKLVIAVKDLRILIADKTGINISESFIEEQFPKISGAAQKVIAVGGPKIIMSIGQFVLFSFVTLFIMYYLMSNSAKVIETVHNYFPLSDKNVDILLDEMGKKTKVLLLSQLLIALIQGTVGAIGFLIFGVNGVFLWGIVMVIMSFIPFLGSFVVWLPASIYLIALGDYFNGIGLILWGVLAVGIIDDIVRPKLTSAIGRIHPVIVLLGIFIGLKEWGLIGLILGPLIIAVLLSLIKMFREEYLIESHVDEERPSLST